MRLKYFLIVVILPSLVQGLICPDGESECPEGSTCCLLKDGDWGCCPFENAVCCGDHEHCCPEGSKCDHTECIKKERSIFAMRKEKAQKRKDIVICPDKDSYCPSGTTCCALSDSSLYGCCPTPKASCCNDLLHCCPNGMRCESFQQRCLNEFISIPWLVKMEAKSLKQNEFSKNSKKPLSYNSRSLTDFEYKNIICPDKRSQCPAETTCCILPSGRYGCCPTREATCCADHLHCCPNGMKCDVSGHTCTSDEGHSIPSLKKLPSDAVGSNIVSNPQVFDEDANEDEDENEVEVSSYLNDVECPDKKSKCPAGTTCCILSSGSYGCCPAPQATCCPDRLHCCPEGMECDTTGQRCIGFQTSIPWLRKFPSTQIKQKSAIEIHHPKVVENESELPEELKAVPCGSRKKCPALTTCCTYEKRGYTEHMCCPLQNAVCCENSCCPAGFQCYPGGRCEKHATRFNLI